MCWEVWRKVLSHDNFIYIFMIWETRLIGSLVLLPELIFYPNLPVAGSLFLLSANNSLSLGPAICVLQKHHTEVMGSGTSTQHHFAFQNAEKGVCFLPSA